MDLWRFGTFPTEFIATVMCHPSLRHFGILPLWAVDELPCGSPVESLTLEIIVTPNEERGFSEVLRSHEQEYLPTLKKRLTFLQHLVMVVHVEFSDEAEDEIGTELTMEQIEAALQRIWGTQWDLVTMYKP
jgi:hypothetical protein